MGFMQEFKEFAIKGNVIDLAVGVIVGSAFGKIVDSIVSDLIMPVVGLAFGKLDFFRRDRCDIALGQILQKCAQRDEMVILRILFQRFVFA